VLFLTHSSFIIPRIYQQNIRRPSLHEIHHSRLMPYDIMIYNSQMSTSYSDRRHNSIKSVDTGIQCVSKKDTTKPSTTISTVVVGFQ